MLKRLQPGAAVREGIGPLNRTIDEVNRLSGEMPKGDAATFIELFELTSGFTYPNLATASTSYIDDEPTAWAKAKRLWCHKFGSSDTYRSYGGTAQSKEEKVWQSAAPINGNGYAPGGSLWVSGDRVLCWYNRQSGRWEILSPPKMWAYGKLDENLSAGAANTATVSIYKLNDAETAWVDSTDNVEARAPPLMESGDQFDSGIWVEVGLGPDGRIYATNAECNG